MRKTKTATKIVFSTNHITIRLCLHLALDGFDQSKHTCQLNDMKTFSASQGSATILKRENNRRFSLKVLKNCDLQRTAVQRMFDTLEKTSIFDKMSSPLNT